MKNSQKNAINIKHQKTQKLYTLNKCNYDILAEIIPTKTRSKDIKIQKVQTGFRKAVGVISKASDSLIELKNIKNLIIIIFRKV